MTVGQSEQVGAVAVEFLSAPRAAPAADGDRCGLTFAIAALLVQLRPGR